MLKLKVKNENRDSKLISFLINNKKLLQKCKVIWTKIENLKIKILR